MKTIIIPDIHQNIQPVQRLLAQARENVRYVFLGDWWDKFESQPGVSAQETTEFLKSILHDDDKTFLYGNHDVQYDRRSHRALRCSGFSTDKFFVINSLMRPEDWDAFRLHAWGPGGTLLTHAGFNAEFLPESLDTDVRSWMLLHCHEALRYLREGKLHELLQAGWARGGRQPQGGVTWNDFLDHVPVPGVRQVFGHTPARAWRKRADDYCIDNELRSYALLHEDGRLEEIPC